MQLKNLVRIRLLGIRINLKKLCICGTFIWLNFSIIAQPAEAWKWEDPADQPGEVSLLLLGDVNIQRYDPSSAFLSDYSLSEDIWLHFFLLHDY